MYATKFHDTRPLRPLVKLLQTAFIGVALTTAMSGQAAAQNKPFDPPSSISRTNVSDDIGFRRGSFVVAPIPFESPSLGTGLALGGAYLFKNDTLSDASTLGFGGFKSSNGSEAYGGALNLAWDEDRWTLGFVLAEADLNYDLFVLGLAVPVRQKISGAGISLAHKPYRNFSIGASVGSGDYQLELRGTSSLSDDFLRDSNVEVARVSVFGEHDTRDDTFYPTEGQTYSATFTRGEFLDSNRAGYTKAVFAASNYFPVFSDAIIATHAVACSASSESPFFDTCSLGMTDNFRGYVSTQFLDDGMVSFQAEYRARLSERFGFVAFAGAGAVDDDPAQAVTGDYKLAGGFGLRIRLSKSFPLDYAIDLAANEDGEQLLYISVGQRF